MAAARICGGACVTVDCSPSGACFDRSREYRYALWRRWSDGPLIGFVLLNPSTADETTSDRTMTRVKNFAKASGHGGVYIVNAFALIATDPKELLRRPSRSVGKDNDSHLLRLQGVANKMVLGWGDFISKKDLASRKDALSKILGSDASALGLTKSNNPRHPLYIRAKSEYQPFSW